jgi:hypothetical protein
LLNLYRCIAGRDDLIFSVGDDDEEVLADDTPSDLSMPQEVVIIVKQWADIGSEDVTEEMVTVAERFSARKLWSSSRQLWSSSRNLSNSPPNPRPRRLLEPERWPANVLKNIQAKHLHRIYRQVVNHMLKENQGFADCGDTHDNLLKCIESATAALEFYRSKQDQVLQAENGPPFEGKQDVLALAHRLQSGRAVALQRAGFYSFSINELLKLSPLQGDEAKFSWCWSGVSSGNLLAWKKYTDHLQDGRSDGNSGKLREVRDTSKAVREVEKFVNVRTGISVFFSIFFFGYPFLT